MSFIDELTAFQTKKEDRTSEQQEMIENLNSNGIKGQVDLIFSEMLERSCLKGQIASTQYDNLDAILKYRDILSKEIKENRLREDVSVIGGVTEKICQIGLESAAPGRYAKLPKGWDWIGDYAITGLPFNLYISVKSYYAKERLIVSGTGQGAAPVIGYGLFKDIKEWSQVRVHQYRHRGFVAIYMPSDLYDRLNVSVDGEKPATSIENIYFRPLLRDIHDFPRDIANIISDDLIIDLNRF